MVMRQPSYSVGDLVRVSAVPPSVLAEMPEETVSLFHRCVGQPFRIVGFGRYGHLELRVSDHDTIWIEADYVAPELFSPEAI
jgi:hypothetical protein